MLIVQFNCTLVPVTVNTEGEEFGHVGACHREQFVNKCLRGLTGTALRCIIR